MTIAIIDNLIFRSAQYYGTYDQISDSMIHCSNTKKCIKIYVYKHTGLKHTPEFCKLTIYGIIEPDECIQILDSHILFYKDLCHLIESSILYKQPNTPVYYTFRIMAKYGYRNFDEYIKLFMKPLLTMVKDARTLVL